MIRAHHLWAHKPKDGRQTLIYGVWLGLTYRLAWIDVDTTWLREEASINDLKALAIAEAQSKE